MLGNSNSNEISIVKNRLVNTSLVVSSIAGFPLLIFSVFRSIEFHQIDYVIANTAVYLFLLILTFFRKKINYIYRASFVVLFLLLLAITDFYKVGFLSLGFMWMVAAAILSFLYFDFKIASYVILISLGIIITMKLLILKQIITFNFDYNIYTNYNLVLILRTMSFMLISFVIIFSIKQITTKFNDNIEILALQKNDLFDANQLLINEIEQRKKSEQVAVENEKKFRNVFITSSDPMLIISPTGIVIDYNPSFKILSEMDYELKNTDIRGILPHDYRNYFNTIENILEKAPPRFEMKYISGLDKRTRFLDITISEIDFEGVKVLLAVIRDNTEKIKSERDIYTIALEAEEKERFRMSKELHDGLGPLLSTLKIYFEALDKLPDDKEIKKRINNVLNESIKSVKEISNNLSPYLLQNLGTVKAIKAFIEKIAFTSDLKIELNANFDERLNDKIEITIYRLITELLNNTMKHAKANKVLIDLTMGKKIILINYSDDGIGFNALKKNNSTGIGLFNMKSRIEKLGGIIEIKSSKGKGFNLKAVINLNEIT